MKLSAEEYMDLCKRCWHSYIAFPAADFELAYANNVSPLDACTAIWSIHRKELSLTDPEAAPTQGADARPVAIYQVRYFGSGDWRDVSEAEYQHARMHPDMRDRIVYATRDAAPSDAVNTRLAKFLDVAAGEGYVFDGIDAGELFLELFPDYFKNAAIAPRGKT